MADNPPWAAPDAPKRKQSRDIAPWAEPKREQTRPAPWAMPQRDDKRDIAPWGPPSMKRGGRVHRTGIYKLHRGERVIPARGRRARRR